MKTLLSLLTAGLGVCVQVANAQNIDSANTTGRVIVTPGGTPAGQFVAPWVDVPPTMQYIDVLPVVRELPHPPLPFGFVAPDAGGLPGNLPLPTLEFTASLSGTNEVPPNHSTTTGTATFTLEGNLFRYQVFFPLPSSPTGAHIHGPAMPGQNTNALFALDGPMFAAPEPGIGGGGYAFTGNRTLSSEDSSHLQAGLWYVNVTSARFPDGELRGQILPVPPDSDHDGVPDDRDVCSRTPAGAVVNAHGCSIAQLSPCDANWRNHGAYARCVIRSAVQFQRKHLITSAERRAMVREAVRSDCGKHYQVPIRRL